MDLVERRRIWNEQGLGALARPMSAAEVGGARRGGGPKHGGGVEVSERDGDGNWTQRRIGSVVGDEAVIAGDSVLVSSESLVLSASAPKRGGGSGTTDVKLCDYLDDVDSSLTLEGEERVLEFDGGQVEGGAGRESEWARDG